MYLAVSDLLFFSVQAVWCVLPCRDLLVVASQKGIQVSHAYCIVPICLCSHSHRVTIYILNVCLYNRCMNLMDPLWCTGMHWTHQRHPQVTSYSTLIPALWYVWGAHTMSSITAKAIFARGIAAVRDKYICVGKWPKHRLLTESMFRSLYIMDFRPRHLCFMSPVRGLLWGSAGVWCSQ